jgi:excisionase family DNA binding protein
MDEQSRLLTAQEVAERLGVKVSWVRYASQQGTIPSIKLGRYRRYRWEAIETWIREKQARNE